MTNAAHQEDNYPAYSEAPSIPLTEYFEIVIRRRWEHLNTHDHCVRYQFDGGHALGAGV